MKLLPDTRVQLFQGDSFFVLDQFDDESMDALITDPPAGIAFMGKQWDRDKGGRDLWIKWLSDIFKECYRVMKPGAYALVWALPRTSHWTGMAIEDAGFIVRDVITHHFGSGFPKSLNISKAIDQAGGECSIPSKDRVAFALALRHLREAQGFSRQELASWFPQYQEVTKNWERMDVGFRVPSEADFNVLVERLSLPETWRKQIRAEDQRLLLATHTTDRRGDGTVIGLGHTGQAWVASTDIAKQWDGWGTALKPASEHWILARKPFDGSLTQNVLEHGTGALNIDACRIEYKDNDDGKANAFRPARSDGLSLRNNELPSRRGTWGAWEGGKGRWPANLILSDDAPEELDRQSFSVGIHGAGKARQGKFGSEYAATSYDMGRPREMGRFGDTGGASRFFYCPKPSRREREAGLEDFPVWTSGQATGGRKEGSAGLDNPRAGAGRTSSVKNHHPTVKSITLMRYLCKLITPSNGIVLDPFMGSGSTGCACVLEGFQFRGIELDPEYVVMSRARIEYWKQKTA